MNSRRFFKSVGLIGAFTALSRLLGLVRDLLMAGFFGTSLMMDAFVVAFTVPNLFRRLFGEGALSSAFVPVLVETRRSAGDRAAWNLVNRVLLLLAAVLVLITGAVLVAVRAIPLESAKWIEVASLLQIMMPYMIFICLAAVSMGILNSFHHFAVPAFAPCLLNVLWIATLVGFVPALGEAASIRAVAWAVLAAGLLQWMVQWPVLYRLGWRWGWGRESLVPVRKILRLMGPAALGMAVLQLNVVIDRALATWVGEGAPSALFFSERLVYFPLGILATALGTVLLPTFAGQADDRAQMRATLVDSLRHLLFVMIPAAVGLWVLAAPVVQMIFEWRAFGAASTWKTALALQCYAPGLVVFSLAKVFVPAFYGLQDTRTPVRIGLVAVAFNLALNLLSVWLLPQAVKHAGLALATVLASVLNMSCLACLLHRRLGRIAWAPIASSAARAAAAALLMAAVLIAVGRHVPALGKVGQIGAVLGRAALGAAVYLGAACALRAPELREFSRAVRRPR